MRGQVGTEYLLLVALLLAVLIPIAAYTIETSQNTIRISEAREAVDTIGRSAENLFHSGGGRQTIFVRFPSGTGSTFVGNRTIVISLQIAGRVNDVVYTSDANVNGSIPVAGGVRQIILKVVNNTVQIT